MRIYALQWQERKRSSLNVVLQRTLKPHTSPVVVTSTDKTGTLLATGAADSIIKVWDIRGGFITHTFRGHSGVVSALLFFEALDRGDISLTAKDKRKTRPHMDGDIAVLTASDSNHLLRLASGGEDGKIRIWSLTKRKSIAILDSHVSVVRSLDFSGESRHLASASRDKTIILWDSSTWKQRRVIPVMEVIESVKFLLAGSLLVTGGTYGCLRLWSASTGAEITREREAQGEGDAILHLLSNENRDYLISVHSDHYLAFHSTADLHPHNEPMHNVEPLSVLRRISGTHDEIIDMAFVGENRSLLALATNTESVRLLSLGQSSPATSTNQTYFGADVGLLTGHEDIIICLTTDWSGLWLATGAKDNTARIWRMNQDLNTFEPYGTCTGHAESIGAVCFPFINPSAGDGTSTSSSTHPPPFLLTGSQDRTVKKWTVSPRSDSISIRALYTRKAHDKDINALAISWDCNLFASASQDRTVKIWSVEEGETQGVLRGHKRGVWSVAFAPKDATAIVGETGSASTIRGMILTGSGDKTVKIWSLSDYTCVRTFEGHSNSVLKVLWLPPPSTSTPSASSPSPPARQTYQIATAGGDGLVKIWDPPSDECLATLDNHTDRIWALALDFLTRTLVSGGGDSVITFWKDTTTETTTARDQAATQRVEQDQDLVNRIHHKQYREAITLALALDHPARLLSLFQAVIDTDPAEQGSISGVVAVDEVVSSLSDEQLLALLRRVRDWNTNARTCNVAQRVLNVVVRRYPAQQLAGLARRKGGKEVVEALKAYTERHFQRVEDLWGESWVVEFLLGEMGGLMADPTASDGGKGGNGDRIGVGEDVVML